MTRPQQPLDPDHEDVVAAMSGDTRAFERLVQRYANLVRAITRAAAPDQATSDELAQDIVLDAWRGLRTLREPSRFRPWLRQIARNHANRSLRDGYRVRARVDAALEDVPDPAPGQDEHLEERDGTARVDSSLASLPPEQREVLVLYYYEGKSVREVARLLDLEESTARKRMSRAREALRDEVHEGLARRLDRAAPRAAFVAAVMAAVLAVPARAQAGVGRPAAAGVVAVVAVCGLLWALYATPWAPDASERPPEAAVAPAETTTAAPLNLSEPFPAHDEPTALPLEAEQSDPDTCVFRGKVVDEATELPLGGASVYLTYREIARTDASYRQDPVVRVTTDPQGSYSVPAERLSERFYSLSVTAPGYAPAALRAWPCVIGVEREREQDPIALAAADTPVRVRVTDTHGTPLAGVDVLVRENNEFRDGELLPARSVRGEPHLQGDRDGWYATEVSSGYPYTVYAMAEGFDEAVQRFDARGDPVEIQFQLEGAISVSGRVVDSAGNPVSGANLFAINGADGFVWFDAAADGSFWFELSADGGIQIQATTWGTESGAKEAACVHVAASDPTQDVFGVEIRLRPTHTVTGTLLDEEGNPTVGTFDWRWATCGRTSQSAETDEHGRFVLESVPEDGFVQVKHDPGGGDSIDVDPPQAIFDE